MLSRTAESMFWLARYVERAEHIARIVSVGHRMNSMAGSLGSPGNEWQSTLVATGCAPGYFKKYEAASEAQAIDYLVRDGDNPSSILSCLGTARQNGRAVRTALSTDMWNALNDTWQRARNVGPDELTPERITDFLEWVKERSFLFYGAYTTTMLRNDTYFFTRLGSFLERADNTARILDVKYHILLPGHEGVGGALDYYQWQAILRSVSALRSYHWIYRERLKPWNVAELLILHPEMPRSLRSCADEIARQLDHLAEAYGGRRGECHRLAGEISARLRYGRIEHVFQSGLHEFLTEFIDRITLLGNEIVRFYFR